ncbi:tRNA (32-2'-O)-methyltransferase regulator THADA-like, partial [Brachyhypopomus gauderio]|uniref:tRNA (32-2'-O)-methyltransferase regulator THADA-like n=1 Tax=Brachyhypopomus gauderio TaxID=698409 RepID=UPI004042F141
SETKTLQEETLSVLLDSELMAPRGSEEEHLSHPGAPQYLQSLTRLAASLATERWASLETDGGVWWEHVLTHLLGWPHYEVRQLALERLLEKIEEEQENTRHTDLWPLPSELCTILTSLALHELHPTCLAKFLHILSIIPLSCLLPWSDGGTLLADQEALERLLTVTDTSAHSVELHCAALTLASRLVVHLAEKMLQDGPDDGAVSCAARWGALVTQCCGEEQPVEVKMTAADVLVKATPTLLTSTKMPLDITQTLTLWQNLFTLLQDEDEDVRDRAADFICSTPTHTFSPDVAPGPVAPPVALEMGVWLLCQLIQVWDQVAIGMVTLTKWLLGSEMEEEPGREATPVLDLEFLFEKGDLNLWAEPLQWARLLHRHLLGLSVAAGSPAPHPAEVKRLSSAVEGHARSVEQAMTSLPALAQFTATTEHVRLAVLHERLTLAQSALAAFER